MRTTHDFTAAPRTEAPSTPPVVGGRATRDHDDRAARHSSPGVAGILSAALLLGLCAAPARAQVPQFDGTYIGLPVPDKANRSPPCTKPPDAVMDVQNGAARMRSSIDRRKGTVQPDGTLTLNGELVVGSQHVPGLVEGRFTKDSFEGVSRFPVVGCSYRWSLRKTQ